MPRLCLLVLSVLSLGSGCASWETTRRELVMPINELIHVDYPAALAAKDASKLETLHAPGLALDLNESLLSPFEWIDRARCAIREVRQSEDHAARQRAYCEVRLDGVATDGFDLGLEETQVLDCERRDGRWRIVAREVTSRREVRDQGTSFRDETAERGLTFLNRSRGVIDRNGVIQRYPGSSGLGAGDVNGDGADDLLLVAGGRLSLFLNRDGRFEDVSNAWGIEAPETGECRSAYFADVDNDGDADLFVGMLNAENLLFRNDGERFHLVPESVSGLTSSQETTSACFADFDGDGNLDLYVANGRNLSVHAPEPVYNAKNGTANQLFRGHGDGTFEDVTDAAEVGDTGWALGCAIADVDLDGDVDLYVANDFGFDVLYRNNGDGTFDDVTEEVGITFRNASMSADFGDVNGDGYPDVFASGMASNSRWIMTHAGFPLPAPFIINLLLPDEVIKVMWEMFHGNRLYLSQGDGTYREAGVETGTDYQQWGWGSIFLDYDNDGLLDIYGTNGFWTGDRKEEA
jgi:hypothetical protein